MKKAFNPLFLFDMTLSLVHFRAYLISLRDGPLADFQMSNGGF